MFGFLECVTTLLITTFVIVLVSILIITRVLVVLVDVIKVQIARAVDISDGNSEASSFLQLRHGTPH